MTLSESFASVSYIAAIGLFILSLGGLSQHESSRRGNMFGIIGMLLALVATLAIVGTHPDASASTFGILAVVLIAAGTIGAFVASRVAMTSMPELVAMLHSFVGAAAVLVGFSNYLGPQHAAGSDALVHELEIYIGIFIGAITFTGSIIAFGKLNGKISGKPLMIPGRHLINLLMVIACVVLGVMFVQGTEAAAQGGLTELIIMTVIAGVIGVHLVMAIGGADMPVVVSMLNSYSGWAAAAAGFMLENDLLIVTGALVGSSGAILSFIMCRAMNRSFISVILGGFGTGGGSSPAAGSEQPQGEVTPINVDQTADMLSEAKNVIIVP